MRVNRSITALLAGSVAVATLSACGGNASGTSNGGKTSASGVLNISMPDGASEKDNNNPYLATSASASVYVIQAKVLSTFVVPKKIWPAMKDPTTDTVTQPVGTGPYALKTFTPQTITLDARSVLALSGWTTRRSSESRSSAPTGTATPSSACGQAPEVALPSSEK